MVTSGHTGPTGSRPTLDLPMTRTQSVCDQGRTKVLSAVVGEGDRSATVLADDACLVLGEVAALLADPSQIRTALEVLVSRLGLGSAALRDESGEVCSVGLADGPTVEMPVFGRSRAQIGSLTVTRAMPDQLPVLRTTAAVLGLALAQPHVTDVLEDDREALADALHDGPVQSLVVARYVADAAVRGGDPVAARDAVQAALIDVRRFLWALRPRGAGGLVEAFDQLSAHVREGGGPAVGLVGDVDAARSLRGAAGVTVFRIVQSVAKPDAPAVKVTLRSEASHLVVDVEGGSTLPNPDRWARRVQSLGGELTSEAGRLRLVLPDPETRTAP